MTEYFKPDDIINHNDTGELFQLLHFDPSCRTATRYRTRNNNNQPWTYHPTQATHPETQNTEQ